MRRRTPLRTGSAETVRRTHNRRLHTEFISTLFNWYKRHGRDLPWRKTSDPYRILVSEIMLQQTQVSRVFAKYLEFLHRFPTLRILARARQRTVVVTWRGLGYNNRAVRLHRLAQAVVKQRRGRIPRNHEALVSLPGIGRYTANAILSLAFGKDVPVVDVNVRRLLSRVFWKMDSTAQVQTETEVWRLASLLLPRGHAHTWNQALMDVGATMCTARHPLCASCPVAGICKSRTSMKHSSPARSKREPSLDGIPNRIYRGRIIEQLRQHNGHTRIPADVLGKCIYHRFSHCNETWLRSLLARLQKDGLIALHGGGEGRSQYVSLA